jgi:hypothetical protein
MKTLFSIDGLRACELTEADIPALQKIFEANPEYFIAVADLAYFLVIWWPPQTRRECEAQILRHWYDALGRPDYSWQQAQADWRLSVEQCLNVPFEWCSKADTVVKMRWLWEFQLANVQAELAESADS